jgi:putative transcriptional regulator
MGSAFESIKQGLTEAIAHASGQLSTAVVHPPQPLNVKAIRKHVGMTQTEFAAAFGISVSTLRHWERGDRIPRGPARVLLCVVAKAPRAVLSALATPGDGEDASASGMEEPRSLQGTDGEAHRGRSPRLTSASSRRGKPRG